MRKAIMAAAVIGIYCTAAAAFHTPEPPVIEYRYEVEAGDTVWDIAKKIALPEEDVRKIVWQIEKDNAIENADIQPGQVLKIRVTR